MVINALYRVSGRNSDGDWQMFIKAKSPMAALEHAAAAKSWDIVGGIHVAIEVNFYDMIEHEAMAAAAAQPL